ncbi:MAG TPA: VOC family protein [Mycobacterium sp.]|nr:VOC family protein [Mycobacterium sp.]
MTTGYRAPLGAPAWIDLATSDLDRAKEFYGTIFGWTFETAGEQYGGYVNAFKGGSPVGGLMATNPEWNAPDAWTTYFHTDDIQSTAKAGASAGGTSCVGPMEVPQKGWMAMGTDAAGAVYGLWQPTGHRGFEVIGEQGAPAWHQLTTRDFPKAVDFYRTVFGWETRVESDTDEFRYTNAVFNGEPLLGVMDGSAFLGETPSHWSIFFGVDDVDKTLRVVTELGGGIVRGAEDTPYGRLAAASDPTGAAFNLSSLR